MSLTLQWKLRIRPAKSQKLPRRGLWHVPPKDHRFERLTASRQGTVVEERMSGNKDNVEVAWIVSIGRGGVAALVIPSRCLLWEYDIQSGQGMIMSSASMAIRAERQLVYEWYTPSLARSVAFLQAVGFKVLRQEEAFAEMAWGSSPNRLLVEQVQDYVSSAPAPAGHHGYHGNLRVLVEDVDAVYQATLVLPDIVILKPLRDQYYGLRDFTLGGPYGLALRFATPLPGFSED